MDKYCIFQVYDYKGGELSSAINLTFDDFIVELSQFFEYYFEDVDVAELTVDEIKERITTILTDDSGFYGNYAGGDPYFCGTLYKVSNNTLEEVEFLDYVEEISEEISRYARDNY